MAIRAVCFDAGQTLLELDAGLLATRLAERDLIAVPAVLHAAIAPAWRAYDDAVAAGTPAPWHVFMAGVVGAACPQLDDATLAATVDWLWHQQPRRNLWRRPVPGMIEVARALRAAGVAVAIISNSEGRLAQLIAEVGWADDFAVIADSGVLGVEKPARGIFDWTFAALGVAADEVVHVGDSWTADVVGARGVGARAIWFGRVDHRPRPEGVAAARDAAEVSTVLGAWGVLPSGLPAGR